ncbi:hypothetical protein [Listeria aquatica]|uniref:Uncharacterized protein n=1 Tax=Listeria aquatica FSL S10-1188 TaxID=1265818 RepID=W7AXN6_9LIST|nr:hypothetical protein [Listeria aquatica]EUJ19814.1 hypothetical protein MAQA_06663 [Listeria aquatica FSL S10-1188]
MASYFTGFCSSFLIGFGFIYTATTEHRVSEEKKTTDQVKAKRKKRKLNKLLKLERLLFLYTAMRELKIHLVP